MVVIQSDTEEVDFGPPMDDVISIESDPEGEIENNIRDKFRTLAKKLILKKLSNFTKRKVQTDALRSMFRKLYFKRLISNLKCEKARSQIQDLAKRLLIQKVVACAKEFKSASITQKWSRMVGKYNRLQSCRSLKKFHL